jgi:hypothetical protein
MKKRTLIGIITGLLVIVAAFSFQSKEEAKATPNFYASESKILKEYSDVSELEKDSELIIKGKKLIETPHITRDGEMVSGFYSISDVEVKKVFKNANNEKVSKDITIKVLENGAYDEKTNTIFGSAGYQLMKKNKNYVLFLKKDPATGQYFVKGAVFGKVAIDSQDIEYGDKGHVKEYMKENVEKITKEVKKKYQ